jgi:hypothetical protein
MAETFPEILCRLRKERRLNQRTAAAALHISQALLSHYENGLREPGLAFVREASDYYGVSADYLLGRTDIRAPLPASGNWSREMRSLAETSADLMTQLMSAVAEAAAPECCGLLEDLITVQMYALLRDHDTEGASRLPEPLCRSLIDMFSALARAKLQPGQPGAPALTLPPELAEKAEGLLLELWDEWRDQV